MDVIFFSVSILLFVNIFLRHLFFIQVEAKQAMLLMDESFSVSLVGRERMEVVPHSPVACWSESDLQLCVAPGIVCTSPSVTAGGGDNISAAAIAMQLSGAFKF